MDGVGARPEARFWAFVKERQAIWHRRFEACQPRPWTADPILQDNFFTNVYRRQDTGTIVYHKKIARGAAGDGDLLWRTCVYRFHNRVAVFERHDIPPLSPDAAAEWAVEVTDAMSKGERMYTAAHYVHANDAKQTFKDCAATAFILFPHAHIKPFEPQELFEALAKNVTGFGPFVAHQVVRDLIEENRLVTAGGKGWAVCGPGAVAGARMIDGDEPETDVLNMLVDGQPEIPWGGRLDHGDVEHALCEWYKYERLRVSGGTVGRIRRFDGARRKP